MVAVGACAEPSDQPGPRPVSSPSSVAERPSATPTTSSPARPTRSSAAPPTTTAAGDRQAVVVRAPGPSGGNDAAPWEINLPVPAGRGDTKPCHTTGTAPNDGYPEHAFTFDVSPRVRRLLQQHGVTVVMTRNSDV